MEEPAVTGTGKSKNNPEELLEGRCAPARAKVSIHSAQPHAGPPVPKDGGQLHPQCFTVSLAHRGARRAEWSCSSWAVGASLEVPGRHKSVRPADQVGSVGKEAPMLARGRPTKLDAAGTPRRSKAHVPATEHRQQRRRSLLPCVQQWKQEASAAGPS